LAIQGHPRSMILVPIESAYGLPISRSLIYGPILHLRYGDLLPKNCLFFLPLSHSAPSFPMLLLEFCAEVNYEERVMQWRLYAGARGEQAPNLAQVPKFLIGSIVISLSRCCLPNDEGPDLLREP